MKNLPKQPSEPQARIYTATELILGGGGVEGLLFHLVWFSDLLCMLAVIL